MTVRGQDDHSPSGGRRRRIFLPSSTHALEYISLSIVRLHSFSPSLPIHIFPFVLLISTVLIQKWPLLVYRMLRKKI